MTSERAPRPRLSDWELWACANTVIDQHGVKTPRFVAERIGELAMAGDEVGVATWKAIVARIDRMGVIPEILQ